MRQSSPEWETNVTSVLESHKFDSDGKLFVKGYQIGDWIILSLFVDDFYVIANRQKPLDDLYDILSNHYDEVSKKQGDILEYLGMSMVKNSDNTIIIWQPAYINKMLKLAGISSVSMEDNLSTIEMIKGDINHKTGKHISPKFNYTKQQV